MPLHMRNTIKILSGSETSAIESVKTVSETGEINHFDLNKIAQPNESNTLNSDEWYQFWFNNWGTRSNTFFSSLNGNVIEFLTEITPPLEAVTKWAKEHGLSLEMKSTLGGMYTRHIYTFQDGNLVNIDSYELEL